MIGNVVYTPLVFDALNGSNQSPLNPKNWQISLAPHGLQIVSNACESVNIGDYPSTEVYYNAPFISNGQYAQVTINQIVDQAYAGIILFSDSVSNAYAVYVQRQGSSASISLGWFDGFGGGFLNNTTVPLVGNDVIRLEVYQGILTAFWNKIQVLQSSTASTDLNLTSGLPGPWMYPVSSVSDVRLTNFSAGNIGVLVSTATALISRNQGTVIAGASVPQAWPQVTANGIAGQNLDLIQIVNFGDSITLQTTTPVAPLVNVDYQGNVHFPALNATNGTRIGVFFTRLAPSNTLAQIFADAFENLSQLDILQVVNSAGGNVTYSLNYLGVATGS